MNDNDNLLKNRLMELANRCYNRETWTYSDFLTLAEQEVALSMKYPVPMELMGGYEISERKIAVFGDEDLCHWESPAPIVCVKIAPTTQKFADNLTHRDFLGSLMALGLRREVLGDIVVSNNCGYLFCMESIAEYVSNELTTVKNTNVYCQESDPPVSVTIVPEEQSFIVASERLDAIVAAIYNLSRSESQELIKDEKVFIAGRLATSASAELKDGALVSVRGMGRFKYEGIDRETRKGKLRVLARVY